MRRLPFVKVEGSGNDFILLDARRRPLNGNPSEYAKAWCDRRRGIGGDGLLVVISSRRGDARMRIFNPDGSEAAMCGNGLRCVAWYLQTLSRGNGSLSIETGAGLMKAQVVGLERVRSFFQPPRKIQLKIPILIRGKRFLIHRVDTGVPHAVLPVSRLDRIDVSSLGPVIRNHRIFQPAGTNVDWVQIQSPHRIAIRTYERGVEAETLACGTGAVAAVTIAAALGRLKSPVEVLTAGGEHLTVGFGGAKGAGSQSRHLYLEGSARISFEGAVPVPFKGAVPRWKELP